MSFIETSEASLDSDHLQSTKSENQKCDFRSILLKDHNLPMAPHPTRNSQPTTPFYRRSLLLLPYVLLHGVPHARNMRSPPSAWLWPPIVPHLSGPGGKKVICDIAIDLNFVIFVVLKTMNTSVKNIYLSFLNLLSFHLHLLYNQSGFNFFFAAMWCKPTSKRISMPTFPERLSHSL